MSGPNRHGRIVERVATRLKLKQLRLLVAVAEQASILKAAESLNMSQPAATKLLKDLETDFGVQLFERSNRGALPTAYGAALVRHGKLILAQLSNAAQELDDLTEGTGGRVMVGTLLAASAAILPLTIARIREQRPEINIVVREGTNDRLIPALRHGDLDLVVGRLPEYRYREDLLQECLYEERTCIVARQGHPLLAADQVDFADLLDWPWVLPPPETTLRRQIDKAFLDAGHAPPAHAVESVSLLTNQMLLARSDMLTVWPYQVIRACARRDDLAIVPFQLTSATGPVGVSYRRIGGLSPAAEAFLAVMRAQAGELVLPGA